MAKKTYSVTLEKNVVDDAVKIAEFYGGKLSPIINSLLDGWVKQNKKLEAEMKRGEELSKELNKAVEEV